MLQYLRCTLFLWTTWLILPTSANAQSSSPDMNPSDCGLWYFIEDNGCDSPQLFEATVSSAPGTNLGVDVYLEKVKLLVTHEWLADLEISLVSPSGKRIILIDEVGGGNKNFGDPSVANCSSLTTFVSHVTDENCDIPTIDEAAWPYLDKYLPLGNFSEFNDGSSPVGNWYLEICDDAFPDTGSLQFVELVFAPSPCLQPTDLELIMADSNSAQIDWVSGALDCSNTIIEYGPPGFTPGTGTSAGGGTVVNVGCPPAAISGLDSSSEYEVYVRQNCGGGTVSLNSCPIQISTTCSPAPITLMEDFNTQDLCSPFCGVPCEISGFWSNSLVDDYNFDWIIHEDSTGTSGTGPSDDFPGGGKYIYIDYSASGGCSRGNFAALVSSCVDVVAHPDTCDLSFDYHMFGSHVQSLRFQITLDGGANWIELWSLIGNQGDQWRRAYIDLDAFHGQTVQFRFLGEGGSQKKGDIALDNLTFYGSVPSISPVFTYFEDGDGDGYGGNEIFYQSCQPFNASGFVPDNTDCDDSLPFINPGMAESPCDNFDLNCDPSDETILPPLTVMNDTVCSGDIGFLEALPTQFNSTVYWYAAQNDTTEVATGASFSPLDFPTNLSTTPIILTFFAEEISSDSCVSISRTEGQIVILPQPEISTLDMPSICHGESYDLTTIDVIDAAGANGLISYHGGLPIEAGNEIDPLVFPTGNETYYIASTPVGGCTDVVSVEFDMKPTPDAEILGNDFICHKDEDGQLVATDLGNGLAPLEFDWNLNSDSSVVTIFPNISPNNSDIYMVTITGANGCSDSDTLDVATVNSNLDPVTISSQPVSVCQGSDGSIFLNPQNGEAPFDYFWEGNGISGNALDEAGSFTISNLEQGAYSITISDGNPLGCSFIFPLQTVDGPGAILTDSEITPVSCNAGSDGCIEINVVGNAPSILWETGETTEQICGLAAGQYSVTITDGSCQSELTFTVTEPDKLVVSTNIEDVTCHGLNDGRIELSVFNGNGGYQYQWGHGPQTSIIQNLTAGDYSITVTDSKGCFIELPFVTVDEPDPIGYQIGVIGEPTCFGGGDGHISIVPTGGTAPFDVDWSNAGMGTTINSLSAGTYDVSIDDANGCVFIDEITLEQPDPIQILLDSLEAPKCNGIDDGSIFITSTGGNTGFSYIWSNGMTDEDLIEILSPGTYAVTVIDALGCIGVSEPYGLPASSFIEVSITADEPDCVGVDNGEICASVQSGGVAPFDFNWSTNEFGECQDNLPPGEYTLTVTDSEGCKSDTTISLVAEQVLSVDWVDEDPSCFEMATGRITLNVSGGTQAYEFLWTNGESTSSIDSLPSGSYGATVTDAMGCQFITSSIPLKDPPRLVVEVVNVESVTCFGDEDGSVDLNVFGGTAPIALEWSNGLIAPTISGLAPGTYNVTATDDNGCVNDTVEIEITVPTLIEMETTAGTLGCTSFSTDTLCLGVQGGISPYEYLWSDGSDIGCLINAPIGDYSVTVTDENGCTSTLMDIKVDDEIDVMTLVESIAVDSICAGDFSGELEVAIEGGVAPYQFIWNTAVSGTTTDTLFHINNLGGGNYQVTITDNFGCTKISNQLQVVEADSMKINAPGIAQTPVNCFGGEDGAIDISPSGGFFPYGFYWENEAGDSIGNTEDLTDLFAGEYFVTVTSEKGCQTVSSVVVMQPEAPLGFGPSGVSTFDETCFQDEDGRITVSAAGGTAPYYFVWSTGDTTLGPTLEPLVPGEYFVTIVDDHDCAYFSNAIEIFGADTSLYLSDFEIGNASCFGEEDAFIDITMEGGFGDYIYSWVPSENDEDLLAIPAGLYDLTVWDEHLCQFDTVFEVLQPDELVLDFQTETASNGNNGAIICQPSGGEPPYTCQLSTGETGDTFSNLSEGWYELSVVDANLCETSVWVYVPGVTAASEKENLLSVSLFPNPSNGKVWLEIESEANFEFDLKIIDALGRQVFEKKDVSIDGIMPPLDLSFPAPGIYFVAGMKEGRPLFSERVVIVK